MMFCHFHCFYSSNSKVFEPCLAALSLLRVLGLRLFAGNLGLTFIATRWDPEGSPDFYVRIMWTKPYSILSTLFRLMSESEHSLSV